MKLNNPLVIGFGISSKATYDAANEYASGAIIGSAFVKALPTGDLMENVKGFMREFR